MAEQNTTTEPELRELQIDGTEHWALTTAGETLCGLLTSAEQPFATQAPNFCNDCQARFGCDECGHGTGTTDSHLWAPAFEAHGAQPGQTEVAEYIYSNATCWAEHICRECSPELYAQALTLAGLAEAPAEAVR